MGSGESSSRTSCSREEALAAARELGIDFAALKHDLEQFLEGLGADRKRGRGETPTNDGYDSISTGEVALAHLAAFPDYYIRPAVRQRDRADSPQTSISAAWSRAR